MKNRPRLPQLEKACAQQRTPKAAKKKKKIIFANDIIYLVKVKRRWEKGEKQLV